MGSNGSENAAISGSDKTRTSETTVEIKIKTLDSQTYTLQVDKCVPVIALKEQIATVTGVLSEQQRLICRGKVLKDDQLLSAYHVEDGHTLHLVVRQPAAALAENASDDPEGDPASSSGHSPGSRVGGSVLLGSFNISEHGDGVPDLGRIVSSVLNSFGITGGNEDNNINETMREGAPIFALSGQTISSRQRNDQAGTRNQSIPNISTSRPTVVPSESLQPPVIADSLTTLLEYMMHLRREFDINVRGLNNIPQAPEQSVVDEQSIDATSRSCGPAGLPTPASLAEVVMSTRQLLNEQTAECLLLFSRQMECQANVTDPSERSVIQMYALRSGALLQNLGALLLELGRTMMTLRMGQQSGDAIVNAGPAIFISTSGPNPIMVQPLPFQPGSSLGAIPVGSVQNSTGSAGMSFHSGFTPRNIDIRIRTARDRRDPASSQHQGQTVPQTPDDSTSQQATVEGTGPSGREPEVRVLPLRSLLSAATAPAVHSTSDSSSRSLGLFFPVLARVEQVTSQNSNNTRASQASPQNHTHNVDTGRNSMPYSAPHEEYNGATNLDDGDASSGQGLSAQAHDGVNQFLRNIISGGHGCHMEPHNVGTGSAEVHNVVAQDATSTQESTPPVSEDGLLLSNILRQVMPILSESMGTASTSSTADGGDAVQHRTTQASTQDPTGLELGWSSHQCSSRQGREPPSPPRPPKRQRRE